MARIRSRALVDGHSRISVQWVDWATQQLATLTTLEPLDSFVFVQGDDECIVATVETGFGLFYPASGDVYWLTHPAAQREGRRLSDGRVGPDGPFWVDSMMRAMPSDAERPTRGFTDSIATATRVSCEGASASATEFAGARTEQ